jgi:hypothetical protein
MKGSTRAATAIAVGYMLGRQKKLRTATLMAAATAVGGTTVGGLVMRRGMKMLGSSDALGKLTPQLTDIADTVRGDLLTAGKAAVTAAATSRLDTLTDSLHERAERVRNPASEVAEGAEDTVRGAGRAASSAGKRGASAGGRAASAAGGAARRVTGRRSRADEEYEDYEPEEPEYDEADQVDEAEPEEAEPEEPEEAEDARPRPRGALRLPGRGGEPDAATEEQRADGPAQERGQRAGRRPR